MSDAGPKKHHWVPRSYLKNFATQSGGEQLYLYQKNKPPILVGVTNIAAENNLYSFTNPETGETNSDAEKWLSEIEAEAIPVIRKLLEEGALEFEGEEGLALLAFVAVLATRGPSFTEWQRNMKAEGHKLMMQAIAEDPEVMRKEFAKAGIAFSSDKELLETRDYALNRMKIEVSGGKGQFFKEAMEIAKDLAEHFTKKSPHLLLAPENRPFITSDNPVVLQRPPGLPWHLAGGFGYGTLFLPLSPRVCLVLRNWPLREEVIQVGPKWVDAINQSVMRAAKGQVFAPINSRQLRFNFDRYPAGAISKVKSTKMKFAPYVFTSGMEIDPEIKILEHYSIPEDETTT